MGRNQQVRNHVSDLVEHGIDRLHHVADRFLVYPLAAIEGAIQGAAQGVHDVAAHKHQSDRAMGAGLNSKCNKCKSGKPHGSAGGSQHVGPSPYEFYSVTPAAAPTALAGPPSQFQYQYHAAFPVPCRPPY